MSDKPVVHIGENSQEHVAFKLMAFVLDEEYDDRKASGAKKTRKLILDTYAECLKAAKGFRTIDG